MSGIPSRDFINVAYARSQPSDSSCWGNGDDTVSRLPNAQQNKQKALIVDLSVASCTGGGSPNSASWIVPTPRMVPAKSIGTTGTIVTLYSNHTPNSAGVLNGARALISRTSDAKIDEKNGLRLLNDHSSIGHIMQSELLVYVVGDVFELKRRKLWGKREAWRYSTRSASSFSKTLDQIALVVSWDSINGYQKT